MTDRCIRCDRGQRRGGAVWCDRCTRDGRRVANEVKRIPMRDREVYREVDWDQYTREVIEWLEIGWVDLEGGPLTMDWPGHSPPR